MILIFWFDLQMDWCYCHPILQKSFEIVRSRATSKSCAASRLVKNKSYNDALETFEKIKIYNLNSLNSEAVDFKTLMALEIYKLVNDHVTGRDHRHKAKQLLKGMHPNPDPQNERHMKKFLTIVSELYNCQKNPSHLRYSFLSARKTYQIKHGPVIARDRVAQSFYF